MHEVNRSSAELMDRVLAFAASPKWDDAAETKREIAALQALREKADDDFRLRIRATIRHIEALAKGEAPRRPVFRAAAAASAAALMAATGCPRQVDDTHMCEMAPPPYETIATGTAAAMPTEEAVALTSEVSGIIGSELCTLFEQAQMANVDVLLNLVVASNGTVARCSVGPVGDETFRANLCASLLARRFCTARVGWSVQMHVSWDGSMYFGYTGMVETAPYDPTYTAMAPLAP